MSKTCHIHLMPDGSVRFSEGPSPQDGNYTTLYSRNARAAEMSASLIAQIAGLPLTVHAAESLPVRTLSDEDRAIIERAKEQG